MKRHRTVLLTGPTGSGKSPLGDLMQVRGLCGRRCWHFDFGARLRAVAEGSDAGGFSSQDIDFIRRVLAGGALLEDDTFPLALRILELFINRHRVDPGDWLAMNGLPRHAGQARALDSHLNVQVAVSLECPIPVILERIALNTGGDRLGRSDDELALVRRKLEIFGKRTRPLVDFYAACGALVVPVAVQACTTPEDVLEALERVITESGFTEHPGE